MTVKLCERGEFLFKRARSAENGKEAVRLHRIYTEHISRCAECRRGIGDDLV